jgi:pimeloyl-ACP methyl ester carboxylesterase
MSQPTRRPLPLILIRGFGGLDVEDEKRIAYQGFNDGTVYPRKRGENYIYEGFLLRFMKSAWRYQDATNVVGYYPSAVPQQPGSVPTELSFLKPEYFSGDKVVIDPAMALHVLRATEDPCRTLWVFRYYDLDDRKFEVYGKALVRLIDFIRALAQHKSQSPTKPKVNIIAHSMGGLLVRQAVQCVYPEGQAGEHINKIVTLGTPHQGISFQFLKNWLRIDAAEELQCFNPEFQQDEKANRAAFTLFGKHFPLERLLTVVGTNYHTYDVRVSSRANRLFSVPGEFGPNYNRSDGLVKQAYAQIPGAARTFVHKCHGGFDSLVTARESFEIATRFFFGNVRARLRLVKAKVTRGQDFFGKSEFFFGVSIKPRRVDFDLFHQSAEAENCYGPFHNDDLSDGEAAFPWAGAGRLIWEGYLDTSAILEDKSITPKDLVLRLDIYVGERDLFGVGFSDNVIFRKQYYVRALLEKPFAMYLHADERFATPGFRAAATDELARVDGGWEFDVKGTGFHGTLRIELDAVPEEGQPIPFESV